MKDELLMKNDFFYFSEIYNANVNQQFIDMYFDIECKSKYTESYFSTEFLALYFSFKLLTDKHEHKILYDDSKLRFEIYNIIKTFSITGFDFIDKYKVVQYDALHHETYRFKYRYLLTGTTFRDGDINTIYYSTSEDITERLEIAYNNNKIQKFKVLNYV